MHSEYPVQVGDVLTRPKQIGLVTHYGVAIGANRVLQNTPEHGEHTVNLQGFARGLPVRVHRRRANPQTVIARANTVLADPKKYAVFSNNCEHTVAKIIKGVPESRQLSFWLGLALIVGVVFAARK